MIRYLTRGIIRENPVFVTMLGLCPSLAITTHLANALGLGVALTFVLTATSLTVSLVRDVVPARIRIPVFIAVIAVFVTLVDILMRAYLPGLSERLGIFIPLLVVNCIILARADVFAREHTPGRAVLDAVGTGIGFLLAIALIAAVREVLGAGTLTIFPVGTFDGVVRVPGLVEHPASVVGMGAGALLVFGYLQALFVWGGGLRRRRIASREERS